MGCDTSAHPQILFGDQGTIDGNELKIGYATSPDDTVPNVVMAISASGKVSIGSTTPEDEFFSVVGDESGEEIARFQNNNSSKPQGIINRLNISTPEYDSTAGTDAQNFVSVDTTQYMIFQSGLSFLLH